MNLIEAIVLGIVQGLTEFLPISSSAHLRIVGELFGWDDPGAAFTAITQIGTEAAVLASGFFQVYEALTGGVAGEAVAWGPTIVATVLAFGVGLVVIAWLLRYLDRGSFTPFVVYRVVLGLLILALVGAGVLAPQ